MPRLLQFFNEGNAHTKVDVMDVLADIDKEKTLTIIRSQLHASDVHIQHKAVELTGRFKDHQSVPRLLELIADSSSWIRTATYLALRAIGDERAVTPLIDRLNTLEMVWLGLEDRDDEPWVEAIDHIIPALRAIRTPEARQRVKAWETANPEPPPEYWEWYI